MSETTNLKLFKHDNPETNEEQFDIENYLNGNWDKIDENVGEVNTEISNIKTEKTELEKELKEMQEDYYQTSIRGQASGEYIHVEDSSGTRCKIGISGNSEQETRSGKNLLELKEGTYTSNGITVIVKNGIMVANGTSTAITFIDIPLKKEIIIPANINYMLRAFNTDILSNDTRLKLLSKTGTNPYDDCYFTSKNGKVAIGRTAEYTVSYVTLRTPSGGTLSNFTVKPQLELGDGTDIWEQGGTAPSPGYSSEIKTVGSNINLYDKDKKVDNTALDLNNGLSIGFRDRATSDYITVKANTNYIFSENGEELKVNIVEYDENKQFIKGYTGTSFIASSNTKYIRFYFNIVDMEIIKLEEGTIATSYSKYGQGCINEVICNDNLFNKDKAINGAFILADTGELSYNSNWNISEYIPVIAGKKYIVYGVVSTTAAFYDKNKKFIKTQSITMNNIIVATEEIKYIKIDVKNDYLNTAVIIEGTEEKGYIEHKSQTYTIPTQQEMLEGDYFDWDNEEEVHTWGKYEFTGEEAFSIAFNSNYYVIYTQGDFINNFDYNETVETYKCSHFKSIAVNTRYQNNTFFINTTRNLTFTTLKYSTVTDFKTWLKSLYDAGTPVVVYYKLAIPTRLQFTEEQKALAKELNNARTYKNVTNITTDSKAILSLDYAKDLETLLNNTQALAVNNASEGV